MSPELFTYDDATHTYRRGARKLPGVTTIIKEVGMVDVAFYTEEGRTRGKNVHIACQYLDEGSLDWADFESRFPDLIGYVRAWQAFKTETGFAPMFIEEPNFHPLYLFGGTFDRFGKLPSQQLLEVDIKTGKPEPWAAIQTAAYELLIRAHPERYGDLTGKTIDRVAVELMSDGKFKRHPFKEKSDGQVFLAALNVANWKAQNQQGGRYDGTGSN